MNRVALVLCALLVGCASRDSEQTAGVPKHSNRVQVLMYDSTPRDLPKGFEIIQDAKAVAKPHKVIALLTCEGACHEEALMTEAIIYRAKQMKSDAVVLLPPTGRHVNGAGSMRCVFRANAVVYETR